MQEIKFVQTQQTANDPIWAPIKGEKYFSSTAVMAGQELFLMKSNQTLIKKILPMQREQKTEKDIIIST